jgi:hypothetical protein
MAWRRSARRWRPHMGWIQRTWRASAMSSRATGARHRMSVAFTARRGKYAATAGWLRAVCVHHSQLCGHLVILFWYCSPTMLPTECSRAAQRARGNHRQATRLSAVQAFGNGYLLAAPVKPPPAGAARRAPHAQGHARRDLLSAGSARHRPEDPQCQARCQAAGRRAQLQPRRLGRFRRPQVRAPGQAGWLSWFGMWQWRASECPMCSGHLDSACTSSAFAACHQAGQVAHCMCCPLRPQRRRARRRDEPWRRSGHVQPHARRRQAAGRRAADACQRGLRQPVPGALPYCCEHNPTPGAPPCCCDPHSPCCGPAHTCRSPKPCDERQMVPRHEQDACEHESLRSAACTTGNALPGPRTVCRGIDVCSSFGKCCLPAQRSQGTCRRPPTHQA